jgi:hypothetical protein
MIEQVIGVSASVIGDMASRPNWGLNELDFVFATLVVGSIVNLLLVFLLAPTASSAAGAKLGFLQKAFGEYYLRGWSAPTGHMFEPGFGLGVRAINFAYKGVVFAFIGLCAGLIGTATSNGLLALRKKMDPGFEPAVSRGLYLVLCVFDLSRGSRAPYLHNNGCAVPCRAAERASQRGGQRLVLGPAHGPLLQPSLPDAEWHGHGESWHVACCCQPSTSQLRCRSLLPWALCLDTF